MDIGSGKAYPSNALSNFAPHPFTIDGVECNSMEGFLQSLKFESVPMQEHVCTLVGIAAKRKGKPKKWQTNQTLYWQGKEYPRESQDYQDLLTRAYDALFENSSFRKALAAAGNATLTHNIGRSKEKETVLTKREFISQLERLRKKLD